MAKPGVHVDLETFLEELPSEAAAQARVAAARIDDLEHFAREVEGIERRYAPWAIGAALLSVAAAVILFSGSENFRAASAAIGVVGLAAMAGALPIVAIVYGVQVRKRTRADREKLELNRTYFLPHGGIYFPPGGRGAGTVYITGPIDQSDKPARADRVRAGRLW